MDIKELGEILLHIPAREGSKRVPGKNMRPMNGKPMISYAIEASIKAGITPNLYVNTDSSEIIDFVQQKYPEFKIYKRNKELSSDLASSDQFNYDIIQRLQPDTLIMINPVCPLVEGSDIRKALKAYQENNYDTLISSTSTQMQTFCDGEPVNINIHEPLAPSQSNRKVTTLNWAITIWDAKAYRSRMEEQGFAVLGGSLLFFDLEPIKSIKVSEEKDFLFAENLLKIRIKPL